MTQAHTPRLGVLDWGIGGMGIVRALRARAPGVPVLYLSDTGAVPYGKLPRAALAARVGQACRWLVGQGAVGVIVGCNAASTVLDEVARLGVPLTGVIAPAIGRVPRGFAGTIGIIGGARTIRSGLYRRGLAGPRRRVLSRIAQPLSAHIERGTATSERCARDLDRILRPLREVDLLVLACTHYPSIADAISARTPGATLLDPCDALVAHVARTFPRPAPGTDRMTTTGDPRAMRQATLRAWSFDPGPCLAARVEPRESSQAVRTR